jgi:hypothetical protein
MGSKLGGGVFHSVLEWLYSQHYTYYVLRWVYSKDSKWTFRANIDPSDTLVFEITPFGFLCVSGLFAIAMMFSTLCDDVSNPWSLNSAMVMVCVYALTAMLLSNEYLSV